MLLWRHRVEIGCSTEANYDPVKVGWKYTELKAPPGPAVHPHERRKV